MLDTEVIVNLILTIIIAIVGAIGNLLVIIAFCAVPSLRNITHMYVAQLAIVDLIKVLVILPTKIVNQFQDATSMNAVYCQVIGVLRTIGSCQPALLLAMIAIVRYFKVIKTNSFNKVFTLKKALLYGGSISITTIIIGLLPVFGMGRYTFSRSHGVCFVTWSKENIGFRSIYYICNVGVTLPILVFCYYKLFRAVRRHNCTVGVQLGNACAPLPSTVAAPNSNLRSMAGTMTPLGEGETTVNVSEATGKERSVASRNDSKPFVLPFKDGKRREKCFKQQRQASEEATSQSSSSWTRKKPRGDPRRPSHDIELEVTLVMFAVVVVYVLCWIPALIVTILNLSKVVAFKKNFLIFIVTMIDAKVALNPIVYGLCSRQFRVAFKRIWRKVRCK
eukprot:gene18118-19928_t